jgi:hypothetical protein
MGNRGRLAQRAAALFVRNAMTYTRPTLAAFQALYPQFSTLTDGQYAAWAGKVEPRVTDRYGVDQQDATELMLAHTLTLMGVGTGAAGAMVLNGATDFESGDFAVTLSEEIVTGRAKGGLAASSVVLS